MKYNIKKLLWLSTILMTTLNHAMHPDDYAGPAQLGGTDEIFLSTSSDKKQNIQQGAAGKNSITAVQTDTPLKTNRKKRRRTRKLTLKDRATKLPEPTDEISASTQDTSTPISTWIPDCLKVKMGLTDKAIDEVCEMIKEKQPTEYANFLATITPSDDKRQTQEESKAEIAASLFKLMYQHVVNSHQDLAAEHSDVKGSLKETQTTLTMTKENEKSKEKQRNLSLVVGFIIAVIQFVYPYITDTQQNPTSSPCSVIVYCANSTIASLF